MSKRLLCLLAICLPMLLMVQDASTQLSMTDSKGIKWTEGLSWQQVKDKAKKENKYIFVDCYATWCKPCKQMDREVYTVDSVGNYLNEKFISVKLQMDVTNNDNEAVKSWRKTAKEIESAYRISVYPSYVFFAPIGEVVSKEIGYKDPGAFIQVARNATDPTKQYFVLLKTYKKGKLDDASTRSLIKQAKQIGDTSDYRQILNSYYAYLHKQKKGKFYTKENIEFVAFTLERSNQLLFSMFYPDGKEVNKVMRSNWYSKKVVDQIIFKEKVAPFLGLKDIREIRVGGGAPPETKPEPDWNALYNTIAKDYKGDYAGRIVLETKASWYNFYRDSVKYTRALNDKMEKYGSDTTSLGDDFVLNNMAFLIWKDLGSTAKPNEEIIRELNRVCGWMEGVARRGEKLTDEYVATWDNYIDTYANLLHKVGRTAEAIKWEEFAIVKLKETAKDGKKVASQGYLNLYEDNLNKMRKGEPTWPIQEK